MNLFKILFDTYFIFLTQFIQTNTIIVLLFRFVPSSMVYLEKNGKSQDQIAMPSQVELRSETSTKRGDTESNSIMDRSQDARFGFTNLGTTGSVSQFSLMKISYVRSKKMRIRACTGLRGINLCAHEDRLGWPTIRRHYRNRFHPNHS